VGVDLRHYLYEHILNFTGLSVVRSFLFTHAHARTQPILPKDVYPRATHRVSRTRPF
jgi:hypothetical protein